MISGEKKNLPELLSPAGSEESLRAALAGGADAVYFGGSSFSNRMRAKNFTDDALISAIKLCHDCGSKAYITVNTRIRDRELDEVLSLCDVILGGEEKCDAVIMADLGLACAVKERYPHAVLHASTQTSLMSLSDCAEIKKLGFSRLVIPRELSLDEIKKLSAECGEIGFETEMFIHGAHCVSCSGQCLMSFVMGGRSGNRGECAQPCRLPYKITDSKNAYPLSLADMCLAGKMVDVISSGVTSLKIEGRLKAAPYVYGVTKIYRTLLDERRDASDEEIRALSVLFSRGFTDGYFTKKYVTMSERSPEKSEKTGAEAKRSDSAEINALIKKSLGERIAKTRDARLAGEGSTPITAEFTVKHGQPVCLTLRLGDLSVTESGITPSPSDSRPLDEASAAKNLTKLGGTGFSLSSDNIKFDIADGLWLPASALNDLRRRAAEELRLAFDKAAKKSEQREAVPCTAVHRNSEKGTKVAMICESCVLEGESGSVRRLLEKFARVYAPLGFIDRIKNAGISSDKICGIMPLYTPSDAECIEISEKFKEKGVSRILCHTPGQVSIALRLGLKADISYRANITNEKAFDYYLALGCESAMLSPEMSGGAYKSLGGGAVVYGKLPLMALSRCVICGGKCRKGNIGGRVSYPALAREHTCRTELTDRLGEVFHVFAQDDCVNVVYNARPNYIGDSIGQVSGAEQFWFIFVDEDTSSATEITEKFDRKEALGAPARRL